MKSIKDILRSPSFMREVSILLFGFAAVGGLVSVLLLTLSKSEPDVTSGVGFLVQSIIYLVLGIMVRRGSLKALWVTGLLFTLDTLLVFVMGSGKELGAMIVWRGILIYLLIRYVRRQRAVPRSEGIRMASLGELVKEHWLRQGIKLRRGASEVEIDAFEARFNVRLPEDMRECFAVVNGFDNRGGSLVDDEMITFFPLEEIERLDASEWGISSHADLYFVFADWSISAHVYAIRLSADNTVSNPVVVTHDKLVTVADSFGDVMQGYVGCSEAVLFPSAQV